MRRIAKGIGVDAGLIMVGDMDYLKTVKSDTSRLLELGRVIDVPKGSYVVSWRIPETYNGEIQGSENLVVTSGKVFVCDPCYIIGTEGNDWGEYLKATNYCEELNSEQAFIIDEMGGDGEYEVELDFE